MRSIDFMRRGRGPLAALALGTALAASAARPADGPELRLFSTAIVEDIRRTGEAAAAMESSVQSSVEAMERQMTLFRETGCDAADEDPGCGEMRRQLGESFGAMLAAMDEALPAMAEAVERSRDGLRDSLTRRIGRGTTASELQELLLDRGDSPAARATPRAGARSRLSERFAQYHRLVAGAAAGGGPGRLAVTAADIFLDMRDAGELIALTRDEIGRARLRVDIDRSLPGLSFEMERTVDGIRRIVFGDVDVAASAPEAAPVVDPEGEFASPLEL